MTTQVLPFVLRADLEADLAAHSGRGAPRFDRERDGRGRPILTHGTGGYNRGCRCTVCTEDATRARRHARERSRLRKEVRTR